MRLGVLLRPGWLAATAAVFAFAVACFTLLSPWQFGEHDERKAQNASLSRALDAEPRPLTQVLPAGRAPDAETVWTPVTITGRFLPEAEVLARLRVVQGEPAFEVLTPMRLPGGDIVLVDRGFVQTDDRSRARDYPPPPSGEVTVVARVRVDERPSKAALTADGRLQVYGVGSRIVATATGLTIRPGVFQLEGGQPGTLAPLPLPRQDAGPFLSYALQWIAFGVMALLGWLYFTVRELKPGGALHGGTQAGGEQPGDKPKRRKSVAEMLAEDDAQDAEDSGVGGGPRLEHHPGDRGVAR